MNRATSFFMFMLFMRLIIHCVSEHSCDARTHQSSVVRDMSPYHSLRHHQTGDSVKSYEKVCH